MRNVQRRFRRQALVGWMQLARTERAVGHRDATMRALQTAAELAPDNADLQAAVGFGYVSLR